MISASIQATPARKPDADAYSDNPSVTQVDAERWPPDSLPPDVAAVLDDVDRLHRENYAYQQVYRIRAERDYKAWPSPHEVAVRMGGKFNGGIQLHLPFADCAVATVQNRPPDKQPSPAGKVRWRQRNGRKGARVRWAPTATSRSERDDAIIAARAGGQSRADVAAEYRLAPRQISRIATPDAVAAWREHQVTLAISPVNPDDLLNPTYEESSFEGNVDSQCHLPQNWLLDSWRATVSGDVDNVQAVHLVNWGVDADADRINPVDLVRLVQWAPTADNPWSYVASNVAELYRLGPEGETLAYLLSAAPERAVRMVESGCVAKPRAYLATAIRNARAAPPARLDADRGGYVASWLPDGRLPWLDPPAPSPAVELEQPAKPSIWPDLASTAADPRPLEAQKSGARHPSAFSSSGGKRKLEHGQATDDSARHAAE